MNLVNHHILCQIQWQIWWQMLWITIFCDKLCDEFCEQFGDIFCDKVGDKVGDKFGDQLSESPNRVMSFVMHLVIHFVTNMVTKYFHQVQWQICHWTYLELYWITKCKLWQRARETLKGFGPPPYPPLDLKSVRSSERHVSPYILDGSNPWPHWGRVTHVACVFGRQASPPSNPAAHLTARPTARLTARSAC